jgi:CheY-like chemotaxis protein
MSFDIQVTINDVVESFAMEAHRKNIMLTIRYQPQMPHYMVGDPGRVRQIMINLIGNALKFTEEGHIIINVKCSESKNIASLNISVADTGVGIPKSKQRKIFERFTQAEGGITSKYGGTGLGLSISHELVRMMGGEMTVTSKEGKGSTFIFTLALPIDNEKSDTFKNNPEVLNTKKVLLVDNDAFTAKIFKEVMVAEGMKVVTSSEASAALKIIEKEEIKNKPFDVILVDGVIDDMDACLFGKTIKKKWPNNRLAVHSTIGQKGDVRLYQHAGFGAYITKPFTPQELLNFMILLLETDSSQKVVETMITRHLIKELQASSTNPIEISKDFHVLVAEDEPVNQKVIEALLSEIGCSFTIVDDGLAVLDILKKQEFDLILMDVNMPKLDGIETTKRIRKQETDSHIPIIALTAHALRELKEESISIGMDDYITKPVSLERLEVKLHKWASGGKDGDIEEAIHLPTLDSVSDQDIDTQKKILNFVLQNGNTVLDIIKTEPTNSKEYKNSLISLKDSANSVGAHQLAYICDATKPKTATIKKLAQELENISSFIESHYSL